MPGNTGEIRRGASIPSHPPGILAHVVDGSTHRGLLQDGVPGITGSDAGGPSFTHHIKCGGGYSGTTMGRSGGRYSR